MAQTVEELAEILDNIKLEADRNAETFDKLLTSINNKLEFMSNDTEADDLIKVYLTELKKTLEERHALVVSEFNKIETSFNSLNEEQTKLTKTAEMKEMFDIFSSNMQSIARELYDQKELLAQYDERFAAFTADKTDKNEIITSVAGIRKDVEIINQSFETSIADINANIQSIFKNLIVMDPTAQNDIVKRELENIYLSTNAILSALHVVDQKNDDLAQTLENFVTKENYEQSQEKLNTIIEKYDNIYEKLNNVTEKTDLDSIIYKTTEISDKINQLPLREDLKYFSDKTTELSEQIAALPQINNLEQVAEKTVENIKEKLAENSSKPELEQLLSQNKEIIEKFAPVAEKTDIDNILMKTVDISQRLDEVPTKSDIEQISGKTIAISEQLDQLPQQSDMADIYHCVHEFSTILDTLRENLTSSNENTKQIINEQLDKLNSVLSAVVTENDFTGFRHDLADFIQKIIDNTVSLNENLNVNKDVLHNLIKEIESLDINQNINTIANALDGLRINVSDNISLINTKIDNFSSKIDELSNQNLEDRINSLSENIYDSSESIKNMQSEVFEKLSKDNEELQEQLVNFNFDKKFENLSSAINDVHNTAIDNADKITTGLDNISFKIDSISTGTLEEKLNSLDENFRAATINLRQMQADVIEKLSDNNTTLTEKFDFSEINNHIENIKNSVQEVKDTAINNAENLSTQIQTVSSKIDSIQTEDINDKLTEIKDNLAETDLNIKSIKNEITEKLSIDDSDKFSSLNNNIDFLRETIVSSQSSNETSLTEKLLALRDIITESAASGNEKFNDLKHKLDEFFDKIQTITGETEIKIGNSVSEITELKTEIEQISKEFTEWNYGQETRDSKIVNMISSELGEIGVTITTLQDSIQAGVHQELSKNSELVEVQINNLVKYIEDLKENLHTEEKEENSVDLETPLKEIKEKITAVKQEINLINTDITDVLNSKTDAIIDALAPLKDSLQAFADIEKNINTKLDENTAIQNTAITNAFKEINENISAILNEYTTKLDFSDKVITSVNNLEAKISTKLDNQLSINEIKDELASSSDNIKQALSEKITSSTEDLKTLLSVAMNNDDITWAIDNLKSDISDKVTRIFNERNNYGEILDKTNEISQNSTKISNLLDALNQKIDILAMSDSDTLIQDEIDEIREMISSQRQLLTNSASSEKINAIENQLQDLINKIDTIESTDLKDMRENIISTVLNVFEQISFIEESEDIKDFVEEKTEEINQNLIEVKEQLKQISNSDDGYSYTLQDIESDIAKLRLVINEISENSSREEMSDISDNIHKIVTSVEDLQNSLTQEQISDLKNDFEKLSEDILSISSRTNKLLLTSDESYNALNNGLNDFSNIVYKLEERINYLDNKEITERIEEKLDNVANVVTGSANSDKVMRQALMYMGEWIDTTSEKIESLCEQEDTIDEVKNIIEELQDKIPEHTELLNNLSDKFEEQEERLDRLEMKLEKILSAIDDIDDTKLTQKVEKIDKQITKLSNTIEKLASYVDE